MTSKEVKLTERQRAFFTALSAHSVFVRQAQRGYVVPMVRAGLVEARQDESGFYCAITDAGRTALERSGGC